MGKILLKMKANCIEPIVQRFFGHEIVLLQHIFSLENWNLCRCEQKWNNVKCSLQLVCEAFTCKIDNFQCALISQAICLEWAFEYFVQALLITFECVTTRHTTVPQFVPQLLLKLKRFEIKCANANANNISQQQQQQHCIQKVLES